MVHRSVRRQANHQQHLLARYGRDQPRLGVAARRRRSRSGAAHVWVAEPQPQLALFDQQLHVAAVDVALAQELARHLWRKARWFHGSPADRVIGTRGVRVSYRDGLAMLCEYRSALRWVGGGDPPPTVSATLGAREGQLNLARAGVVCNGSVAGGARESRPRVHETAKRPP